MKSTRRTNKNRFTQFFLVLLALLIAGCVGPSPAARSPQDKLVESAVNYFALLKDQDKLPGIHPNEQGSLATNPLPASARAVSYPASVTIRANKQGDESVYSYVFVKETPASPWQLLKATRLDKSDRELEQLFPK